MTQAEPFREPELAIGRVYTRGGDGGQTSLVGGQRVPKDDPRIAAFGCVDELNAWLGAARVELSAVDDADSRQALEPLDRLLLRLQHELFNLGSALATLPEDLRAQQARVRAEDIARLERELDQLNADLPPLRSFVLPGGHRLPTSLHLARTVCRRAERLTVALARTSPVVLELRYLNRLSDALFVFARWAHHRLGVEEVLWSPNAAGS